MQKKPVEGHWDDQALQPGVVIAHDAVAFHRVGNLPLLRVPLVGVFDSSARLLRVDPFPDTPGESAAKAVATFIDDIRRDFAALHFTRPFDRNDAEEQRWSLLCRHIDVQKYRNDLPLEMIVWGDVVAEGKSTVRIRLQNMEGDDVIVSRECAGHSLATGDVVRMEVAFADATCRQIASVANCELAPSVDLAAVESFWQKLEAKQSDALRRFGL